MGKKSRHPETPVQRIAEECLAVRVRLLNRTVTNIFDEALRPLGVKVSQLNVLMVVARKGTASPGEVSRILNMEKSTVSRNVERLRASGWLVIADSGEARRQELRVSSSGNRLIDKALPLWEQAQAETERLLGSRDVRSIHRAAQNVWKQLGET